jgi:uncharacterized membrane protein (UPF0127 family)
MSGFIAGLWKRYRVLMHRKKLKSNLGCLFLFASKEQRVAVVNEMKRFVRNFLFAPDT